MHNKVENNKIARNKPKEVEDFKIFRRVQKKDFPSSWTGRIDIVKMAIQRFPSTFQLRSLQSWKQNSSHPSETQNTPNKAILSRKSNARDAHHPISNYTSELQQQNPHSGITPEAIFTVPLVDAVGGHQCDGTEADILI